jgi:uncharacterized membrane protein YhaH (DUF805 family)
MIEAFNFRGRRGRGEHVGLYFAYTIPGFIYAGLVDFLQPTANIIALIVLAPVFLVMTYLVLTNHVKRLHDLGKSGWWVLLFFVPFVNIICLFYLFFARGQATDNQYGPALPAIPDNLSDPSANDTDATSANQGLSLELKDLKFRTIALWTTAIIAFFVFWVSIVI